MNKRRLRKLELRRETVQDLETAKVLQEAQGAARNTTCPFYVSGCDGLTGYACDSNGCTTSADSCPSNCHICY